MYNVETDVIVMLVFLGFLCLMAAVGTWWNRRGQQEPPRWAEDANGPVNARVVKRIRGYDPVLVERADDVVMVDYGRKR